MTVSAVGAVRTGDTWVPTVIVSETVLVKDPLVPVTITL